MPISFVLFIEPVKWRFERGFGPKFQHFWAEFDVTAVGKILKLPIALLAIELQSRLKNQQKTSKILKKFLDSLSVSC